MDRAHSWSQFRISLSWRIYLDIRVKDYKLDDAMHSYTCFLPYIPYSLHSHTSIIFVFKSIVMREQTIFLQKLMNQSIKACQVWKEMI